MCTLTGGVLQGAQGAPGISQGPYGHGRYVKVYMWAHTYIPASRRMYCWRSLGRACRVDAQAPNLHAAAARRSERLRLLQRPCALGPRHPHLALKVRLSEPLNS